MVYDEGLASLIRNALDGRSNISEKRMLGGICFFQNGNMIGGTSRNKEGIGHFMFRVGKDNEAEALSRPGTRVVEMGKRRMGGFVHVDEAACDEDAIGDWVDLALSHVGAPPPK